MLSVFSLWTFFDQSCKCFFCCWFPYTRNKVANSRKRFAMARSQNTFTFCDCIFHMCACFTQPDLLTSWKRAWKSKMALVKRKFLRHAQLTSSVGAVGMKKAEKNCREMSPILVRYIFDYIHQIYTVLMGILVIATIIPGRYFHYPYLPLIRQNLSPAQNPSLIDCKQSQTVCNCISKSFFPRFCVANRHKQDVKTDIFILRLVYYDWRSSAISRG